MRNENAGERACGICRASQAALTIGRAQRVCFGDDPRVAWCDLLTQGEIRAERTEQHGCGNATYGKFLCPFKKAAPV
jgi:hypothetical protein